MKQLSWDKIPEEIKTEWLNLYIEMSLKHISDAGLMPLFLHFIESDSILSVQNFDELLIDFAKNHPEKLYVVPEEERIDDIFLVNLEEK